jgi:hypothetical protein
MTEVNNDVSSHLLRSVPKLTSGPNAGTHTAVRYHGKEISKIMARCIDYRFVSRPLHPQAVRPTGLIIDCI